MSLGVKGLISSEIRPKKMKIRHFNYVVISFEQELFLLLLNGFANKQKPKAVVLHLLEHV